MKKLIVITTVFSFVSVTVSAQHDHSSHQKPTSTSGKHDINKVATTNPDSQKQLSHLLSSYYNIKNALVKGNAASGASHANEFVRTVRAIDYKIVSEENINMLAKDAGRISETKDLKKQREYFATLSSNMAAVAKAVKLTDQPVYLQYCPMKKASWLSNEKAIKNPYYGNAMLTCGSIEETF